MVQYISMWVNVTFQSIVFALIMVGCNQSSETKTSDESDTLQLQGSGDTLSLTRDAEVIQQADFDAGKFVTLAESLLTEIQEKPISLAYVVDTLGTVNVEKGNYYYHALFSSADNVIKRYSFDPGKDNRLLRIWFVEATYPDTISANKAFEELRKQANGAEGENNYIPGLTYTNDCVIRSYNKIYWLNSGCSYSFTNHQKLAGFMLQSLPVDKIQDSIWCKCGEVICK